MIKSQLNDAESYYARIEADINLQSRMKITTEEAFHFYISYECCSIERWRNMTRKYISTEMLIILLL